MYVGLSYEEARSLKLEFIKEKEEVISQFLAAGEDILDSLENAEEQIKKVTSLYEMTKMVYDRISSEVYGRRHLRAVYYREVAKKDQLVEALGDPGGIAGDPLFGKEYLESEVLRLRKRVSLKRRELEAKAASLRELKKLHKVATKLEKENHEVKLRLAILEIEVKSLRAQWVETNKLKRVRRKVSMNNITRRGDAKASIRHVSSSHSLVRRSDERVASPGHGRSEERRLPVAPRPLATSLGAPFLVKFSKFPRSVKRGYQKCHLVVVPQRISVFAKKPGPENFIANIEMGRITELERETGKRGKTVIVLKTRKVECLIKAYGQDYESVQDLYDIIQHHRSLE